MVCKKPYAIRGMEVACRKCLPCLLNLRRISVHRIMLEMCKHNGSCFVTCTYDDEHLPVGGSLVKKDFQDFIKRLRRSLEPVRIRYFGVGEYGEESDRPHYHAIIFGLGPVEGEQAVNKAWGKGFVCVGDVTRESAQYVAGYVTKKWKQQGEEYLDGREPLFRVASNRPGIGGTAVDDVADILTADVGVELLLREGNIPLSLKHGGVDMPLGPYMRKKLRERVGMEETLETPFGPRVDNRTKEFDAWKRVQVLREKEKAIAEDPFKTF